MHKFLIVLLTSCVAIPAPLAAATATPSKVPALNSAKLRDIDDAIESAIASNRMPGAVFWLDRQGRNYRKAYGRRAIVPAEERMTEDTIFDAASLTKVVACTPAVMLLVERGRISLDAPVRKYIPEFTGGGKDEVTIRQLMTHTSGLRPGIESKSGWRGQEVAIRMACGEKLQSPPGTVFRYSDINFFVLGEVVQRASGRKLERFVAEEIFEPLKMRDTGYLPGKEKIKRIAPTEKAGDQMLRGVVHDPTARAMGGVAGHAGLFTTAADLARYARMLLNEGELDGVRVFKPETVRLMTSVQTRDEVDARRGLGWDIDSGYSRPRGKLFPLASYGHTGFTGTCLWIDPFSRTFWMLLSNRVHPNGSGNIGPLQLALATYSAMAVDGFDFANVTDALPARSGGSSRASAAARMKNAEVLNGIDVLVRDNFAPLKKLRIGLITNHTGVDRGRRPTIDLLKNAPEVDLKALFSPEHGIRGQLDEKVNDGVDEQTGLPVYSLYGERRAPTPEQLQNLDALVFDIQDIGCRFYTYISTMGLCLEAAAKAGIKFFVLDRVNPINGVAVEGPIHTGKSSFTAFHRLPLRHGMTVGELARMFNAERDYKADLTVIALEGWTRDLWFDQTGLPWINPSPNMRSLTAATLYPGVGLHETALSVGRGTGTPFEVFGAPYVDDVEFAAELNRAWLPGVRFVATRYTPTASTFKEKPCGGVTAIITDRDRMNAVDVGIVVADKLHRLYGTNYAFGKVQTLLQHQPTIDAIKAGQPLSAIKQSWAGELAEFKKRREPFLLYR